MTLTWNLFEGEKNWLTQIVQCTVENDSLLPSCPLSPLLRLSSSSLFSASLPSFLSPCSSLLWLMRLSQVLGGVEMVK